MGYQTYFFFLHEFDNLDFRQICHHAFAQKRSLQSVYSLVRIWAESCVMITTVSYGGYDHWLEGW